mmetsp:Transcript_9326/g.20223  ORF Transcript_9326/g.20223 Transcript_9326/m.20223 type:complete len:210 (-) Transcript_9326:1057-1686(-)
MDDERLELSALVLNSDAVAFGPAERGSPPESSGSKVFVMEEKILFQVFVMEDACFSSLDFPMSSQSTSKKSLSFSSRIGSTSCLGQPCCRKSCSSRLLFSSDDRRAIAASLSTSARWCCWFFFSPCRTGIFLAFSHIFLAKTLGPTEPIPDDFCSLSVLASGMTSAVAANPSSGTCCVCRCSVSAISTKWPISSSKGISSPHRVFCSGD